MLGATIGKVIYIGFRKQNSFKSLYNEVRSFLIAKLAALKEHAFVFNQMKKGSRLILKMAKNVNSNNWSILQSRLNVLFTAF